VVLLFLYLPVTFGSPDRQDCNHLAMFKKITSSFILALHNIRSNFFHTILSITGIVIGVAALVSILSLIDGMEKYAQDELTKTTSLKSIMINTHPNKNVNGVWIRKDSIRYLTPDDFNELKSAITRPASAILWQILGKELSLKNDTVKTASHTTGLSNFDTSFHVVHGKIISESDFINKKQHAVVTEQLAKILAGKNDPSSILGKTIILGGGRELELVGVVKTARAPRAELFFPITLISSSELEAAPPNCAFEAEYVTDVPRIKEEIQSWLAKKYGQSHEFTVVTNEFRVEQAARGFKLFRIIMGLIVGISVLVGGIGVMNVLLISVTERTAEIGVRKAVGANKRDIILQFLSESITISLFGSLLGLVIGVLGTMVIVPIVKSLTGVPFQAAYTMNTLLVISILAVVIGIVFGTYPAMRAARLDPVEAIRRE
jgi:putative ABC transport system permease protein